MSHVREPWLSADNLPGNRPISTAARVAALDCLLDDIGTHLSPGNADMIVDYAATRFERGEIAGAIATLTNACDYTSALRLAAVMHTDDTPPPPSRSENT